MVLVSAQGTATMKPFLAGPFTRVDVFDTAALALDRVGVFENRTPAHEGFSSFWDSYCVADRPASSIDVAACVRVAPRDEVGSGLAVGRSIAACHSSLPLLHLAMIYSSVSPSPPFLVPV